jgi:hypothetical protein
MAGLVRIFGGVRTVALAGERDYLPEILDRSISAIVESGQAVSYALLKRTLYKRLKLDIVTAVHYVSPYGDAIAGRESLAYSTSQGALFVQANTRKRHCKPGTIFLFRNWRCQKPVAIIELPRR